MPGGFIEDTDDIEERIKMYKEGKFDGKTDEMIQYEKETGRYAVWRGVITESFKNWLRGEKIYSRDKERISLYVSEDTKIKWQNFIKKSDFSTLSKLVRQSVNHFIKTSKERELDGNLNKLNPQTVSNISHALKIPLTSIKGYSELLLKNYRKDLDGNVLETVRNIFDQSILLENKIVDFLEDIKPGPRNYEILLIEDDVSTIQLITSYFKSKGYTCKGVVSGNKGLEELKSSRPSVILLDIILPDISGYDICKKIFTTVFLILIMTIKNINIEKEITY
ncbi:MAG: response regulator [Candidatus Lokiarchaeota archaeon]